MNGLANLTGNLDFKVMAKHQKAPLSWQLKNKLRPGYWLGFSAVKAAQLFSKLTGLPVLTSQLAIKVVNQYGHEIDYGVVGYRVVTTVGVNYIVDAFQNSVELENMKYHGLGTGSTAEAVGDTALVTELTTEYTGNVRATGTTAEGASANIYQTVATNTMDEAPGAALREHGIFSQAAPGGGVLLDRTVFAAITLANGDSLQTTYSLTLTAGS